MNIKIISNISKLNTAHDGCIKEYGKRLSRYCKFSFISLKKEKELSKYISPNVSYIFVTPSKHTISSEELATNINQLGISGKSDVTFLVGFSDKKWLDDFNATYTSISISPLSLSTGLTAAVLAEQIYRAYRIIKGEPYHK